MVQRSVQSQGEWVGQVCKAKGATITAVQQAEAAVQKHRTNNDALIEVATEERNKAEKIMDEG